MKFDYHEAMAAVAALAAAWSTCDHEIVESMAEELRKLIQEKQKNG